MDKRTTVGIDLAKDVFAICVLDAHGAVLDRKVLRRAAFERWAESLSEPCTVAMEACGSAHHWGRFFAARGHTARLLAAEFVVPFLAWHRMRQGWIEERTALLNRVRGLLAEFGLVPGRSPAVLIAAMARIVDEAAAPEPMRAIVQQAREQLAQLDARLVACDMQIQAHARCSPQAERLRALLGVGPITASAVVATVPDATLFRHGRLFGAWLGLTPRQHSTGGKTRLGASSKRGDAYLRGLLVNGARSALQAALRAAPDKATRLQLWMVGLARRCGYQKALVAIANKHARMIWAMLARDERYDPEAWRRHARTQPSDATGMPMPSAVGMS
ncbi:MAG: IS110 family transposase [Rubrivivax sp.]|nr:IS110 family transposase [Rubrivivax sp.]